jgi:hypothetical protein
MTSTFKQIRRQMDEERRRYAAQQGLEQLRKLRDRLAEQNRQTEKDRLEREEPRRG